MDAVSVHSENSGNEKQIATFPQFPLSFSFTAILSYRMGESLPCKAYPLTTLAAIGRNIMPEYTACLDAGDAHHTFTPENSSQPAMKKQVDRSKINRSNNRT